VVGERTFGEGTQQRLHLPDGRRYLSVASMSASGKKLQDDG